MRAEKDSQFFKGHSLKTNSHHDANFVVHGGNRGCHYYGCHYDILCQQWQQICCHHDNCFNKDGTMTSLLTKLASWQLFPESWHHSNSLHFQWSIPWSTHQSPLPHWPSSPQHKGLFVSGGSCNFLVNFPQFVLFPRWEMKQMLSAADLLEQRIYFL